MTLDSARRHFERRRRDLFRSEVTITRPSTTTTLNTSTGAEVPDSASFVYSGPCFIRGFSWEGTDIEAGGREVRLRGYRVDLPPNTGAQKDDMVVATASVYDSSLVGVPLRVTDVRQDAWQIVEFLIVEEVSGDV